MSDVVSTTPRRFNSVFQRLMTIHWWMAAAYLLLYLGGVVMARLPRTPIRNTMYDVHKSIGVITLILLAGRLATLAQVAWSKYRRRSPRINFLWYKKTLSYTAMYIMMLTVPLAGFLLSNSFRANNVKLLGWTLPDLFPVNPAMVEPARALHFWLAYAFLSLIVLHMIAQRNVVKANWRRFRGFVQKRFRNPV
ncbi:cytochrome b [Parathermosynechococcus lividus]